MATKLDEIKRRLWVIADDLRANSGLKASEYAEPVLGLIFLRFASERFKKVTEEIRANKTKGYEITEDDYLERSALVLPHYAQFDELLKQPENTKMGEVINKAMTAIEEKNEDLKGALPKSFTRLNNSNIFALFKALADISFDIEDDVFGKIYEYFLSGFALAEGQRGGQFFTPTSLVQLIVEIIEPFQGRIFDPACGSGGMFVQSARFVRNHQRQLDDISIWGQEIMEETARICRMNLAVNDLSGTITSTNSLYGELHELWGQFDFVMANPPLNVSGVDKTKLEGDTKRYPLGQTRTDNANYLWIQMFYSALNDHGRAGFVMANSASDARSSELDIRCQLLQKKAVDVIVSIGPNFFYTVTLPCTLWFFDKGKTNTSRENTILFIDARNIYQQVDRAHREFSLEDIEFITNIVRMYRGETLQTIHKSLQRLQEIFPTGKYADVTNLCRVATLEEIEAQGWSLNPGRYVGLFIPPEGFAQFKLHEIAEIHRGITLKRKDFADKSSEIAEATNNSEIYLVRSRNIQNDGSLDIASLEMINIADINMTFTGASDTWVFLQPNDILVATLGNTHNVPIAITNHTIPKNVIFADSLIRIRVIHETDYVDAKSVFTFLKSETGQRMMRNYASSFLSGNLARVSLNSISGVNIFLPPLSRENEVDIRELSSLSQVLLQLKDKILPVLESSIALEDDIALEDNIVLELVEYAEQINKKVELAGSSPSIGE